MTCTHSLPKISIITPSYNQGTFIERTIQSVLGQGYPDLEYIVMDGGSTDATLDVLRRYDGRLVWRSEKDKGQSDAINKGMKMASGDIIAYLNSDDVLEAGALHRVAEYFHVHPGSRWVTGRCRIIDENDREFRAGVTAFKNFLLDHFSISMLLVINPISQPATFWRREIVQEFGFFDVDDQLVMDYEYWLRIGQKYPPGIIRDYLAQFRIHRDSKLSSFVEKRQQLELEVAKRYTRSPAISLLHRLSNFSMVTLYGLLSFLNRKK